MLVGQDTLFYRDLYRHYMPIGQLLAPAAGSAVSVLWDPYLNGGQPWLANPNCFALYPSRVLYFLLSPLTAFNWEIFLHHLLGTLGIYFLARRLRLGPGGAATAAFVWAFSGVSISMVHLGRFLGYHTLPFVALAAAAISRQGRWGRWFAVLTGAFVLQLLSGAVEIVPVSLLLAVMMVVGLEPDVRAWGRRLIFIATSLVLATGLAAVQIVPAVHFLRLTARAATEIGSSALDWSFSPLRIVEVLVPGVLGPLDVANPSAAYWGSQLVDQGVPLLLSVYGGAVAVLLATVALVVPSGNGTWGRLRWALLATIVLSGVVASAAGIPFAAGLFDAAPWLAVIRYPVKLLTASVVPLALLAGWGAQRLTTERGHFATATAVLAAAAAAALVILATGARLFPRVAEAALGGYFNNRAPGMVEGVTAGLDHSALALLGLMLSAGLLVRGSWGSARFLVAVLVGADLVVAASFVWLTGPKTAFATMPPLAASVRLHLDGGTLFRDANPVYLVPALPADRAWAPASWWSSILDEHLATTWSIPTVFHPNTSLIVSQRMERLRLHLLELGWFRKLGVLDAAGVSVILTHNEIADARVRLEEEFPISGGDVFRLYRVVSPPGSYWVVPESRVVEGGEESLAVLLSGTFDSRKMVVLERSPPRRPSLGQRMALAVGLQQTLFEMEVEAPEDAHLVLTLPFHPEIMVLVDARQTTLERANFAFSSVPVSGGRHLVRVMYAPASVLWGALLSVASLVAWLIAASALVRGNAPARRQE